MRCGSVTVPLPSRSGRAARFPGEGRGGDYLQGLQSLECMDIETFVGGIFMNGAIVRVGVVLVLVLIVSGCKSSPESRASGIEGTVRA